MCKWSWVHLRCSVAIPRPPPPFRPNLVRSRPVGARLVKAPLSRAARRDSDCATKIVRQNFRRSTAPSTTTVTVSSVSPTSTHAPVVLIQSAQHSFVRRCLQSGTVVTIVGRVWPLSRTPLSPNLFRLQPRYCGVDAQSERVCATRTAILYTDMPSVAYGPIKRAPTPPSS